MMPRRISRVPPRSEKDGACIIVCASTAAKAWVDSAVGLGVDQQAGDLRDFLLHQRAEVFHQRRLQRRVLARLQHAGDRAGQPPQRHDVRDQPPDRDRRRASDGFGPERARPVRRAG